MVNKRTTEASKTQGSIMASTTQSPKYNLKVKIRDGNAFGIMGQVSGALRDAGVPKEERDQYIAEATSDDYDNLLRVSMNWVNIS